MEIKEYTKNPQDLAQLIYLINYCQNIEAQLDIKMAEQDDLFQIEDYYQKNSGHFWIALHDTKIVGCIALLPFNDKTAVLKKFFTYPEYRGHPIRLGRKLFEVFIFSAQNKNISRIVLDTPENEKRSHYFYEKQGFKQINRSELNIHYPFSDRESRIYEKKLVK